MVAVGVCVVVVVVVGVIDVATKIQLDLTSAKIRHKFKLWLSFDWIIFHMISVLHELFFRTFSLWTCICMDISPYRQFEDLHIWRIYLGNSYHSIPNILEHVFQQILKLNTNISLRLDPMHNSRELFLGIQMEKCNWE